MKKALLAAIIGSSIIACPILYFVVGPKLDELQIETLIILLIIAGIAVTFCFVVGELAHNNSQMDKLWSILPEIYIWVVAYKSDMNPRIVIMAIVATLWGIRLTFNFARRGAYRLKFWTGEEDYRWPILRNKKEFQPRWKWVLFDLFFICIYQNLLVLCTTFPALVSMNSNKPINWIDIVAAVLVVFFVVYEFIADQYQWNFQTKKYEMLNSGKKLEELPMPYRLGFNTTGLWSVSRHPNYFAEQGTWVAIYIFSIAAGVGIFNWSIIGALLLIVLFLGSSMFAEEISGEKYPLYKDYVKSVNKFFPGRRYKVNEN